ncbi:hypothetical protein NDA14_007680 [Ustilago hordei]|uniref:Uncharacterized protein n=1 Tax=Ustilago hordei TaxID=120017 RepID=I2FRK8_USTHO|nr:uncharacterized protein UHO2_06992 [Ustilago hordei]KAJ1044931.1 hypothetical protein NDA10_003358 [Ustilago hordei]KAJ1571946.1 hypothetical protein NDA15_000939 [Ustilago hordei]KAJ1594354.1 hypothetical protein NDA12_000893 [Ustilago hordei]KAJ1598408.1 hypothetical protein NDA14_007680 [Ustilago hordei]UTT92624.1 hypothetical protein NDA17_003043 [Ustilago hordei]
MSPPPHAQFQLHYLATRCILAPRQVLQVDTESTCFDWDEQHCPGHLALLARTTSSPPTYALLYDNSAHQQALYHPSPSPLELNKESLSSSEVSHHAKTYCEEQDTRAAPPLFDPSSSEAVTERAIADDKASCMHGLPDKAMRTLAALSRSKACSDVMVVLAHEIECAKAMGLEQGQQVWSNDWRDKRRRLALADGKENSWRIYKIVTHNTCFDIVSPASPLCAFGVLTEM